MGERLICIQEVSGSIPLGSTNPLLVLSATLRIGKSYSPFGELFFDIVNVVDD